MLGVNHPAKELAESEMRSSHYYRMEWTWEWQQMDLPLQLP